MGFPKFEHRRTFRARGASVWAMEIWINPACSKCRSALSLLDEEGVTYTVRRYLEDVPSPDEIRAVLDRRQPDLTVLMAANGMGHPRLGLVASRKLGDAVRRNRAKRLIREIFRQTPPLPGRRGMDRSDTLAKNGPGARLPYFAFQRGVTLHPMQGRTTDG